MFDGLTRVLIVEDIKPTRDNLKQLFHEEISGCLVDTAEDVESAMGFVRVADPAYDIVVLDFQLPPRKGEPADVDDSICSYLKTNAPRRAVVHCSSFVEHPKVQKHLQSCHAGFNAIPFLPYSKETATYAEDMMNDVKTYVYGERIAAKLSALFDQPDPLIRPTALLDSPTRLLAKLCGDTANHWQFLHSNSTYKEAILSHFLVEPGTDGVVRVSLR